MVYPVDMKLIIISDTHGQHENLDIPDGDVLIHAGDFTEHGTVAEAEAFDRFLGTLPHTHKLVIAGNHDFAFEQRPNDAEAVMRHCTYLKDSGTTIDGIHFYGSPWQPWFMDWAFNLPRGDALREKWDLIPGHTDVLITHGPPLGQGDRIYSGDQVGCDELTKAVERIRPKLHIFGHIHESYGVTENRHTAFINACSCNMKNQADNPPIVVEL